MPEKTFLEFLEETFKLKPFESPLEEVKGTAMAMIMGGGRSMIGSVGELSDGLMEVFYPVGYAEGAQHDQQKNITKINSQMGKMTMLLRQPSWMLVRVDSLRFLDAEIDQDKKMVVEYERAITHIRASDSGIEIATPSGLVGGGSVTPIN